MYFVFSATLEKARKRALEMNESTDYSSNPENSKQKGRGQRNKTKNQKYLDGYESESKEDRNQNQNKTKNASKNRDDMYKNSNRNTVLLSCLTKKFYHFLILFHSGIGLLGKPLKNKTRQQ